MSALPRVPPVPAVLRLVQMSAIGRWRATAEELYREVAQLTGAAEGQEILVSGCGEGTTAEWLAARTRAAVTGVDASGSNIAQAERRNRASTHPLALAYEQAEPDDLPHESGVFDSVIGEPLLSAARDPAAAVAELSRVTKPMGIVILLQMTWSSEIAPERRETVVERIGLRPFLLVEWKQMLRDADIVDIQIQDWTAGIAAGSSTPREGGRGGGGDEGVGRTEDLTWRDKMQIMGRAWRRRGWRDARGSVARERSILRELGRERALGFQLLRGVKWPHATS